MRSVRWKVLLRKSISARAFAIDTIPTWHTAERFSPSEQSGLSEVTPGTLARSDSRAAAGSRRVLRLSICSTRCEDGGPL